jgi:hypothetical protein
MMIFVRAYVIDNDFSCMAGVLSLRQIWKLVEAFGLDKNRVLNILSTASIAVSSISQYGGQIGVYLNSSLLCTADASGLYFLISCERSCKYHVPWRCLSLMNFLFQIVSVMLFDPVSSFSYA